MAERQAEIWDLMIFQFRHYCLASYSKTSITQPAFPILGGGLIKVPKIRYERKMPLNTYPQKCCTCMWARQHVHTHTHPNSQFALPETLNLQTFETSLLWHFTKYFNTGKNIVYFYATFSLGPLCRGIKKFHVVHHSANIV